jgi:dihydrofolate reductase
MSKVRVNSFSISLDGFGAGADQSLEQPLGRNGESLHGWMVVTKTFRDLYGGGAGATGTDDDFTRRGLENLGAWILGRNMFGPSRGPWPDDGWQGWWGKNPPYRVPVFVLTHHPRDPLEMEGGTVFHFVTGGVAEALRLARKAAGERDIRVGGGVETIRQFLRGRLIDELHLAIAPVILGRGEHLLQGIDLNALGYGVVEHVATERATHVVLRRDPI